MCCVVLLTKIQGWKRLKRRELRIKIWFMKQAINNSLNYCVNFFAAIELSNNKIAVVITQKTLPLKLNEERKKYPSWVHSTQQEMKINFISLSFQLSIWFLLLHYQCYQFSKHTYTLGMKREEIENIFNISFLFAKGYSSFYMCVCVCYFLYLNFIFGFFSVTFCIDLIYFLLANTQGKFSCQC